MEPLTVAAEEPQPAERPKDVSLGRAFGGKSFLRDVLETLVLTLVIFLIVNTLTGRFQVRGSSMEPSLYDGQYVLVSKLSYRLGEPQRGDVIVFLPPNGAEDDYIKRIIGLPGERVEIHDGAVWINGARLEEPYTSAPLPYSGSWVVGPGEYFVLGDNRPNSNDSHSWGMLPAENIVGRAWLCYWPPERWGPIQHYDFPQTGGGE